MLHRSRPSPRRAAAISSLRAETVRYRVLLSDFKKAETAPDFFATVRYDDIRRDTSGRVQPFLNLPSGVVLRDVKFSPPSLRYYDYLVED